MNKYIDKYINKYTYIYIHTYDHIRISQFHPKSVDWCFQGAGRRIVSCQGSKFAMALQGLVLPSSGSQLPSFPRPRRSPRTWSHGSWAAGSLVASLMRPGRGDSWGGLATQKDETYVAKRMINNDDYFSYLLGISIIEVWWSNVKITIRRFDDQKWGSFDSDILWQFSMTGWSTGIRR